jgi:MFS family permease
MLIVGRALQGIGAAFLVPGSLAIISATFSDAQRGPAIGTWSGFSSITTAIGPVSGGWLVEHGLAGRVFLNAPFAIIVLVLSLRFMEESRPVTDGRSTDRRHARRHRPGRRRLRLLEWPSLGAGHPLVLGAMAAGVVSLGSLFIVEGRAGNPMLPLGLFRSRPFSLANVLTCRCIRAERRCFSCR